MAKVFIHDQTEKVIASEPNGKLTVDCPSGSSVTLRKSSDGYTDIVDATVADESGKAVFTGLTPDTYNVEISDGDLSSNEYIDVTVNREITIEFITATIDITYPEGSECTVSLDGNTFTAPDTSGRWTCVVHETGAYAVRITDGERHETCQVDIDNNGDRKDVELEFFEATAVITYPAGFECTMTNGELTYSNLSGAGEWTVTIPDSGIWVVACENGDRNYVIDVEFLVDGETKYVDLGDFVGLVNVTYEAGCECSLTNGDVTYTAHNTSGNWSRMVYEPGEWSARSTNGILTKEKKVTVPTEEPCTAEVDITDFIAGIRVIYPEGYACTCNGVSAADNTGNYLFNVQATGDYTINCQNSDGTDTRTETVTITTDWQYETVNLSDFEATINITYPEGAICTCSCDSMTLYAPDITGSWTVAVPIAGEWVITAANPEQTVSSTVNITTYGQNESVTLKLFEATIDVTYPEGATCTCTDGTTTYAAPDTTGSWTVTVPRTGEWLVRAVQGSSNVSESVNITYDGQNTSVKCKFFSSYVNVTYPSGSYKVVLWYINSYGTKVETGTDTSGSGLYKFTVPQAGTYEIGCYKVAPYVGIESSAAEYATSTVTITEDEQTVSATLKYNTLPAVTYTGRYEYTDNDDNEITESDGDWKIRFLTSGVLKFTQLNGANDGIDVFVCGGGGNGGETYYSEDPFEPCYGGGGGGGGYQENSFDIIVDTGVSYAITVGGSGGSSSAFGISASGGSPGGDATSSGPGAGGNGTGKGGKGGSGYTGEYNASTGEYGSFGPSVNAEAGENGKVSFLGTGRWYYSGGGGGYGPYDAKHGKGGANGGGGKPAWSVSENVGSDPNRVIATDGTENTGGGGSGGGYSGGSGIVIIRNKR